MGRRISEEELGRSRYPKATDSERNAYLDIITGGLEFEHNLNEFTAELVTGEDVRRGRALRLVLEVPSATPYEDRKQLTSLVEILERLAVRISEEQQIAWRKDKVQS